MTIFFPILFGVFISAACWIDNGISSGIGQYWWLAVVVAYLLACFDVTLRNISRAAILGLITISGVVLVVAVILFEDLLTIYVVAATLLGACIAGWHYESGTGGRYSRVTLILIGTLAAALVLLPVVINRVEVRLPNLSAGTHLSLADDQGEKGGLSAGFFNRSDDHLELTIHLGTRFYPDSAESNPRLRIDILREKIVVRLLSIRYQTQIGYLDKTLFEITGSTLADLIALNPDSAARLEMEGERLLISELRVGEPLILELPGIDAVSLTLSERILAVVLRLLLLGLLCYAMLVWAPSRRSPVSAASA